MCAVNCEQTVRTTLVPPYLLCFGELCSGLGDGGGGLGARGTGGGARRPPAVPQLVDSVRLHAVAPQVKFESKK
jgi:hypothetical protein